MNKYYFKTTDHQRNGVNVKKSDERCPKYPEKIIGGFQCSSICKHFEKYSFEESYIICSETTKLLREKKLNRIIQEEDDSIL